MRENAAAAAMLTPVTNANSALAEDGRDRQPAGQPRLSAVGQREQVGRGAAFGEEVAHQHEQRDDREDVVAQRLVGGVGDEGAHDLDVAGHQIDAERRGDAERDGDVDAGRTPAPAAPPGSAIMSTCVEHAVSLSARTVGGRSARCAARPALTMPRAALHEIAERRPAREPSMTTKRAGQTGTRSAPSPSNSPLVQACSAGSIAAPARSARRTAAPSTRREQRATGLPAPAEHALTSTSRADHAAALDRIAGEQEADDDDRHRDDFRRALDRAS